MKINQLLNYFKNTKQLNDNSYQCNCPAHQDQRASLTITEKGDKILIHCHAGCNTESILERIGLKMSDLYTEQKTINWKTKLEHLKKKKIEAVYDYTDENNNYTYTKIRFQGKDIIYGTLDTKNDIFNIGLKDDVKKNLYRLAAVSQSKDIDAPIYFVEGEKDVDTLTKLGYVATTCGGVGDWKSEYSKYFKARSVIILPDNDEAGRAFAKQVLNDIKKYAFQVKSVLTSNSTKGDVTDYLTTEKHTKYEFDALINNAHWIHAPYMYETPKGDSKINADLLSYFVGDTNKHLILTKRGVDKELLYIYEHGVYKEYSKTQFKSVIRDYLPKGKATDSTLNNTLNLFMCSANKFYDFDDINTNEHIINLKNGIYDVKTRTLQPHSSDIFSTLQLNCNYFPENVKRKPPIKWLKFIDELCTNEEGIVDKSLVNVIQEEGGLILSNCPVHRTKKAFIMHSPIGNTGKSVFLNIINAIIGKENIANIPMQKMSERFSLGDIHGKRVISIGDQTSEDITDCSIFKQLTGGDYVQAELKGKQSFSFIFTGGIMIACNNLPYFADDKGNHVFDRLLIFPCTNVIPPQKRNKKLTFELLEELDGIFYWFLDGFHRLTDNDYNFTQCDAIDKATIDYRNNVDTLFHFVNSEYEITENKMDRIKKTEFEENYTRWCEQNDYKPVGKKNMKERAIKIGIPPIKAHDDRYYQYMKTKVIYKTEKLNVEEQQKINTIF